MIAPGATINSAREILTAVILGPQSVRSATRAAAGWSGFAARRTRPRRRLRPPARASATSVTLRKNRARGRVTRSTTTRPGRTPTLIALVMVSVPLVASTPPRSTATAGRVSAWIRMTRRSNASKERSRRSGKHLPAREKNWSSAAPHKIPSPSPPHPSPHV